MGLFSFMNRNFDKPGPGVPKNAPRKKGFARFFEVLARDLPNLIKLNLLYFVTMLPAQILFVLSCWCYLGGALAGMLLFGLLALGASVLVGPSTTAVFYIISKMLRDDPGFIWHEYRRRFKSNFKCSVVPGMLYSLVLASEVYAYIIYLATGASWIYVAVYIIAFALIGMVVPYFFLQSGYLDLKPTAIMKNSLLLAIGKFPRSFMGFLMHSGLLLLQVSFIHLVFPVLILVGYTIPILACLMWIWPPVDSTFKIEETLNKRKAEEVTETLAQSGWTDESSGVREQNKY